MVQKITDAHWKTSTLFPAFPGLCSVSRFASPPLSSDLFLTPVFLWIMMSLLKFCVARLTMCTSQRISLLLAGFFDLCRVCELLGDSEISFKGVWNQNLHMHFPIWSSMYHNSFLPMTVFPDFILIFLEDSLLQPIHSWSLSLVCIIFLSSF